MNGPTLGRELTRWFGPAYGVLVGAGVVFALVVGLSGGSGIALIVGGATLGSVVRGVSPRLGRSLGLVPPLLALGILAAYCPVGIPGELAAGLVGLALLLWCGEDPARYPGALGRAVGALAVPAAGFGIAWASSLLLPSGLGSVGVAAALLVLSAAAMILVLRVPAAFDRDSAATS
ncbi:MAG: hypothetical protein L3K10_02610 [Thermoplasmata archaeon]|nr:hypothetical protein [Thermoplasmata archaeon]